MALFFLLAVTLAEAAPTNSAVAHLGAANELLTQERFEEAATEYQKALDGDPKLWTARRDLAVCRFELRQYEVATRLFSELLESSTTGTMAHYYLGRIHLIQGEFPPAIKQFLSIPHAHRFRDEHYFLGMAYFKSAAWQSSVTSLQQAIQENPRDFRSHQLLARALQKLGRTNAANGEFSETRRLLSYYTEGSQAIKRCGQILSNKNAEEIGKTCLPLMETDDVDKLAALGILLGKAGYFEQAEAGWKRAASLDPESPEIRYDLALTCFQLKDRICARDNAKAALQIRPDFPEATVLYGSVLYAMGEDADALRILRKARALSPRNDSVRKLLGNELVLWAEQYAHIGRTGDARLLLSELRELEPLEAEQQQRLLEVRRTLNDGERREPPAK